MIRQLLLTFIFPIYPYLTSIVKYQVVFMILNWVTPIARRFYSEYTESQCPQSHSHFFPVSQFPALRKTNYIGKVEVAR